MPVPPMRHIAFHRIEIAYFDMRRSATIARVHGSGAISKTLDETQERKRSAVRSCKERRNAGGVKPSNEQHPLRHRHQLPILSPRQLRNQRSGSPSMYPAGSSTFGAAQDRSISSSRPSLREPAEFRFVGPCEWPRPTPGGGRHEWCHIVQLERNSGLAFEGRSDSGRNKSESCTFAPKRFAAATTRAFASTTGSAAESSGWIPMRAFEICRRDDLFLARQQSWGVAPVTRILRMPQRRGQTRCVLFAAWHRYEFVLPVARPGGDGTTRCSRARR